MVRLKHKTRREGLILVGSSRYQLEANGEVEVTEDHAAILLQGSLWLRAENQPPPNPQRPNGKIADGNLEELSRDELMDLAESAGVKVDRRLSKPKIEQAILAAKERGDT